MVLLVGILSLQTLTSRAQSKALGERTVERGQPGVEWTLENPSFEANAFDLEAQAVITHQESGKTIRTGLFCRGDARWTFRFTAPRTGTWRIRTFSDDSDLHEWTGTVNVRPASGAGRQGFLTNFGPKWGWAGQGEAFVPQYVIGKPVDTYLTDSGHVDSTAIGGDVGRGDLRHRDVSVRGDSGRAASKKPRPASVAQLSRSLTELHCARSEPLGQSSVGSLLHCRRPTTGKPR